MRYDSQGMLLGAPPSLIFRPVDFRSRDVLCLLLFRATPEYDDILVLLPEVNPITRTEVDTQFKDASANTLCVAGISQRYPVSSLDSMRVRPSRSFMASN